MKKVLAVVALLLVLCAGLAGADVVAKAGIDLMGEAAYGSPFGNMEADIDMGFSFAAEFLFPVFKFFDIGAGAEYQMFRDGISFLPLYGVARIPIDISFFALYATGRIGYNFFIPENPASNGTYLGGLYYAFGGGVMIKRLILVEALYCIHDAGYKLDILGTTYEYDYAYNKLGIYVGLNLKF